VLFWCVARSVALSVAKVDKDLIRRALVACTQLMGRCSVSKPHLPMCYQTIEQTGDITTELSKSLFKQATDFLANGNAGMGGRKLRGASKALRVQFNKSNTTN